MTKKQRIHTVAKSLFQIGESRLATDFQEAQGAEGFQSVEHSLRQTLKDLGPDQPKRRAKVLANAIVEAQLLPHGGDL